MRMKRLMVFSLVALVGTFASARAGSPCLGCGCGHDRCKPYPEQECPDCSGPCCGPRLRLFHLHNSCQAIADLCSCECGERIHAARKLGHGDFCSDCEILPALVKALLSDPCWKVRQAAAWSIYKIGARTELALVALYVSSRLDRHYLVRDKAKDAIDILILCRTACYTELFKASDALVKQLSAEGIRAGSDKAQIILGNLGAVTHAVQASPAAPARGEERIKPPRGAR
jgi:hypothetical protein